MCDEIVMKTEDVSKIYKVGTVEVKALNNVSLSIKKGEFTALAGPSGSGKSTFLNIISGLDNPTNGKVFLNRKLMSSMSGRELSDFRRDHIGFIFQSYNLIPVLTVKENIEYVMILQGINSKERTQRVAEILKDVGLEDMEKRKPLSLSGGQQQRVAVARAMVSKPDIILADEPTANLDSSTGESLLAMMRELNEKRGMTFIFSTHDHKIMEISKRLILLKDGQVEKDEVRYSQL